MHTRTSITLLVLVLIVAGAGAYGWSRLNEPVENPFAVQPDCTERTVSRGDRLHRRQVVVNVFNASTRDELASQTLRRLAKLGFGRGRALNAPPRLRVANVAVVDRDPGSAQVRLVRGQFRDPVVVRRKPDLGDGIDVVLGSGYTGLRNDAPSSVSVQGKQEVCVPTKPRRNADG